VLEALKISRESAIFSELGITYGYKALNNVTTTNAKVVAEARKA